MREDHFNRGGHAPPDAEIEARQNIGIPATLLDVSAGNVTASTIK